MAELLKVGELAARRGEVARGYLPVPGLPDEASLPVILVHGAGDGPTVTVMGGVHGFEYGGVDAAIRLSREVRPDRLRGRLIIAPIVNRTAFERRSIYVCPLDGKNPNRTFPGKPDGSPTERLTWHVFTHLMKPADAVVDLHAGDAIEALVPFSIYPRTEDRRVTETSRALAKAFGLPYLLGSPLPGGSFAAAAEAGIPAFIAEVGGQGMFEQEVSDRHYEGLENVLKHLGLLEGQPTRHPEPEECFAFTWAFSDHDGTYHPTVRVGDDVKKGEKVGEIRDYFGEVLDEVFAPASGPVLFLVTSLAIRKRDPLMGVFTREAGA